MADETPPAASNPYTQTHVVVAGDQVASLRALGLM